MVGKYAKGTTVNQDRSKAEIERILLRYGATAFAYVVRSDGATIGFEQEGRRYRIDILYPDPEIYAETPQGRPRKQAVARTAWEQGVRELWRSVTLLVKAKLEAVECGLVPFDHEFLPYALLPNGSTVGGWAEEALPKALEGKEMPKLLGDGL